MDIEVLLITDENKTKPPENKIIKPKKVGVVTFLLFFMSFAFRYILKLIKQKKKIHVYYTDE